MSILKIFRNIFYKFRKTTKPPFADRNMALRPDGGWASPTTSKPPAPPNQSLIVQPAGSTWHNITEPVVKVLDEPPHFFPQHEDLGNKLDQCLDLGIISTCQHRTSFNSVYFLDIELPCSDKFSEDTNRFNLFIKAMQEKYNLVVVQKERYSSSTTNGNTFKVVFEYNSKSAIFNNRRRT